MAQSTRYRLHRVLWGVVQAVAASEGAKALYNPPLPIGTVDHGTRVLFMLDRGDRLEAQPAQKEKRVARAVIGAFVQDAADPDAACDALHWALRCALRGAEVGPALGAVGGLGSLHEAEVDPQLRETPMPGTVLLSAFEIKYYETYPTAA